MFFCAKKIMTVSLTCISFISLTACNTGLFSGTGMNEKKKYSYSSDLDSISDSNSGLRNPSGFLSSFLSASFDERRNTPMGDFINAAKACMTNDPVNFEGQTFYDLKDFTIRHEDLLRNISEKYQTVGDFLYDKGISREEDLPVEDYSSAYLQLAEAYKVGKVDEFLAVTSTRAARGIEGEEATIDYEFLKTEVLMGLLIPSLDDLTLSSANRVQKFESMSIEKHSAYFDLQDNQTQGSFEEANKVNSDGAWAAAYAAGTGVGYAMCGPPCAAVGMAGVGAIHGGVSAAEAEWGLLRK